MPSHAKPHRLERALAAAAVAGVLGFAVVVSLSDRAPRVLRAFAALGAQAIRRVGEPIGLGGFDRGSLPVDDLDQLGHLVGWGGVMLAVVMLLPHVSLRLLTPAVIAISTALEPLQTTLSQTRAFDPADLQANIIGITGGLVVGAAWRAVNSSPRLHRAHRQT